MTKEQFFKSKYFQFLVPFLVVLMCIELAKNGYDFGQWLKTVLK